METVVGVARYPNPLATCNCRNARFSIAYYNLGKTFETEAELDQAIELYDVP